MSQRVALYARVSRDDGKQDTANQLHELHEFCKRSGWSIEHEYIDRMTGSRSDRPQFQRLLSDASRRKFDQVLFWSLDRFSREGVLPTLRYLEQLDSYRVAWRSYTEPYFDSCGVFRDAVISIAATLAKQERLRISERTKAGLDRVRRSGRRLGRPVVGVDLNAVARLQRQGKSVRDIAPELGVSLSTLMRSLRAKRAA